MKRQVRHAEHVHFVLIGLWSMRHNLKGHFVLLARPKRNKLDWNWDADLLLEGHSANLILLFALEQSKVNCVNDLGPWRLRGDKKSRPLILRRTHYVQNVFWNGPFRMVKHTDQTQKNSPMIPKPLHEDCPNHMLKFNWTNALVFITNVQCG